MIEELHIRNYALIDETLVRFSGGLNILTGETGAGKSILIGALGLVLGAKADTGAIRTGSDEAEVSGVFAVSTDDIRQWLSDHDLDNHEETLIIRRKIRRTGRGAVYIQSRPFPLSDLADLGQLLVDVHGQHDHQSLFYIDQHRRFLDRSGHLEIPAAEITSRFGSLKELTREIDDLQAALTDREKEMEILTFALEEIDEAEVREGESGELKSRLKRMEQSEELFGQVNSFLERLPESRGGVMSTLREASHILESLSQMDERNRTLYERFSSAFYEMEDIVESVSTLNGDLEYDPRDREALEDRLALIRRLLRKYGPAEEDLQTYRETAAARLEELRQGDISLEALNEKRKQQEDELIRTALVLSDNRKSRAVELEREIRELLKSLGMPSADFSIEVSRRKGENGQFVCGSTGIDRVEFLFSANRGEPLKPLKQVASGGELSRVMLAIKTALSGTDRIPVLVFDEIDSGIGGEVARSVGGHMKELARYNQILCITHLASIAVYADNHIKVEKVDEENRTSTKLFSVREEQKVMEIARMLSGDSRGDASLRHAEDLLRNAAQ